MAGIPIGKFEVLGTLGAGAHSTILRIRRAADSRPYALKVVRINGSAEKKFLTQAEFEFEIAQKLSHPSLIKVYSLETMRDWLFRVRKVHLLIEYVNGKTLDTFKAIPLPPLVQIFQRVAAGLAHMHDRGVFHADLKPNNIMLSHAGDVKVLDYGLAWVRGQKKDRVQGTPEYMAPETATQKVVNERTDIYNFGATMYRLVTFRLPPSPALSASGLAVNAKTWEKLLMPVEECNSQAPPKLARLIHRCLAFDPAKRPQRMSEVQEELDEVAARLVKAPEDQLEAFRW